MKNNLLKLLLASLAIFAGSAQAQSVTDTNVTITGTFTATCAISGNNLSLGSADLPAYIDATFPSQTHVRYPINLEVTCNSGVPWRMYNISPAGVPLSIGSVSDNTACIAANDTEQPGEGYKKCADNTSTIYHGGAYIQGTGTVTKPVLLLIWHNTAGNQLAYKGSGAINAVVPMRMEY